jgi:hypothetical protein
MMIVALRGKACAAQAPRAEVARRPTTAVLGILPRVEGSAHSNTAMVARATLTHAQNLASDMMWGATNRLRSLPKWGLVWPCLPPVDANRVWPSYVVQLFYVTNNYANANVLDSIADCWTDTHGAPAHASPTSDVALSASVLARASAQGRLRA